MGNIVLDGQKPSRRRLRRLPISKKLFVVGLSAALAVSISSVATAVISSSGGVVNRLAAAPASVRLGALEHATQVQAFDEKQGVTLASALTVDAVNSGSYAPLPPGGATIAAGTKVDSHLIHSDIPSRNYTVKRIGSVTFSTNILGVIGSTARLASSDATLGATGTLYAGTTQWRGVEPSGEGGSPSDKLTISADRKTLSFELNTLVMDEIRVITSPSLTTTITDSPDPVDAGSNVTYTITVTNNGTASVPAVQVKDAFPGATYVSSTPAGCVVAAGSVTCPLGTIAGGGSAVATVTVKAPSVVPVGGTLTNTATAPPATGAPVSQTTTVTPPPSLSTTITDSPHNVTVGNNVQYTLTVKNIGTTAVTGASVVDTIPSGTSVVGSQLPANCSTGSGTVTCTLGNLGVGDEATVQFVVTVPGSPGTIVNSAVASPGTNSPGTVSTIVEAVVDGVAKGYVLPGGSLTIPGANPATLTLPNTGNGAPVEITQATGTFCPSGCTGPATEISPFDGYTDPANPLTVVLEFSYPATNAGLSAAAFDYGAAVIYKNDGVTTTALPACATPGQSNPGPCVDGRTIEDLDEAGYRTTFTILYLSGDPRFAKH